MALKSSTEPEDVAVTPVVKIKSCAIDPEKLRSEISTFQDKLKKLTAENPSGQSYLINAYHRCIRIRQCLLDGMNN